jgi:hypothetical protein
MRTLNYKTCKVCKTGDEVYIPHGQIDLETNEILSVECTPFDDVAEEEREKFKANDKSKFDNCEATILENNSILCYKCAEDFYFDGVNQVCQDKTENQYLHGCVLSYDNVHCVLCEEGFQMDGRTSQCHPDDVKFDPSKFENDLQPGASQDNFQMSVNSNSVERENDYFQTAQSYNDDGEFDSLSDGQLYI